MTKIDKVRHFKLTESLKESIDLFFSIIKVEGVTDIDIDRMKRLSYVIKNTVEALEKVEVEKDVD